MTLDQLRIFATVADTLNMTRAAQSLHLSQPAISAAIAALEGRHNTPLFNRIGRGLSLTEAGRLFLPHARAVLSRAAEAARVLDDLAGLVQGEIRIAASQTVATYWLPPRLARFAAAYPGLSLSLSVANTQRSVAAVAAGTADLGFVEGPVEDDTLLSQRIGGDHLCLVAQPHHPLRHRLPTPADLRAAQWIARETGSGTRDHWASAMADHGITISELHILLDLPSNGAVMEAVESGDALAAVSSLAAAPRLEAGLLAKLDWDMPARNFTLIRNPTHHQSHAVRAFMTALGLRAR